MTPPSSKKISPPSASTKVSPLSASARAGPLRVAMIAPPWIPVPPPAYGGIEAVVALLCDELIARGHSVTLFAAPGSRSAARICAPLASAHPDRIGSSLLEADYVNAAYDAIEQAAAEGRPFDVVHDHSGFTAVAMAHRLSVPVIHTLHGAFGEHTSRFYARHGHKAQLVALSSSQRDHAPAGLRIQAVIPNPVRVGDWPFEQAKDDYLLWVGRMDPVKGAHRAIAVARRAGTPLLLAGPIQPGQERYFDSEIAPQLDGERIRYLGEIGGAERKQLFARARGLLMPIRWPEPFGMVMVEALACGTPVLVFPEGAAREIVIDSENGFHVHDEHQMAEAIGLLGQISPWRCRESVAGRYDAAVIAARYESTYRLAIDRALAWRRPSARRAPARQDALPLTGGAIQAATRSDARVERIGAMTR